MFINIWVYFLWKLATCIILFWNSITLHVTLDLMLNLCILLVINYSYKQQILMLQIFQLSGGTTIYFKIHNVGPLGCFQYPRGFCWFLKPCSFKTFLSCLKSGSLSSTEGNVPTSHSVSPWAVEDGWEFWSLLSVQILNENAEFHSLKKYFVKTKTMPLVKKVEHTNEQMGKKKI